PCLYLIDEIFRGTNNRERFLGSLGYIRALAATPSVGLVTTHDLELTSLAGELPAIKNLHFSEEISSGPDGTQSMHFNYRVQPGPCDSTNALRIMKDAGLPVDQREL